MARVGLKEIAKRAGVSAVTVSAALNGTGRVSEKKRREIMSIAERLKYQPNTLAQILKSKRNDSIGLIINDDPASIPGSGIMNELVMCFIKQCEALNRKYHIEFVDPLNGKDELPDIISSGFVGGVLCAGYICEHQTRFKDWLGSHSNFPFVKIEEPYDYCLRTDLVNGMLNALKYLKQQGHTKVALHIGPLHYDFHNLIFRGYKQGTDVLSMQTDEKWIYYDKSKRDDMVDKFNWTKSIMSGSERPTAMICAGMGASRNIINNLYQLGCKVPDDLSIIGFGAAWEATAIFPHITAVERDVSGMMEKAIVMLQQRMKGDFPTTVENWIDPKLVIRNTVCPV